MEIEPATINGLRLPTLSEAQPNNGTKNTAEYMTTLAKRLAYKGSRPLNLSNSLGAQVKNPIVVVSKNNHIRLAFQTSLLPTAR